MPVHIEELSSEVTVSDGGFPFTPAQLERLVQIVLQRLEKRTQAERQQREATRLRPQARPPTPLEE